MRLKGEDMERSSIRNNGKDWHYKMPTLRETPNFVTGEKRNRVKEQNFQGTYMISGVK
jgi:hypothetical protein